MAQKHVHKISVGTLEAIAGIGPRSLVERVLTDKEGEVTHVLFDGKVIEIKGTPDVRKNYLVQAAGDRVLIYDENGNPMHNFRIQKLYK